MGLVKTKNMSWSEYLTIRVNYQRAKQAEAVRSRGLSNYFVIGKAIYYIHEGTKDSSGNVLNLKYVLVRPDINFSETGVFDYIPGWPLESFISENYYSHDFDEF